MAPRVAARCGSRTGRLLAGAAQPAGCVRPDRRRGGAAAESRGAHASSDWPAPATRRAALALAPGAVAGYAKSGRGSRSPGRAASLLVSPHPNAHAEWPASPRAIPTRPLAPAPAWPRDDRRVHHAPVQHERARPAIAMRGEHAPRPVQLGRGRRESLMDQRHLGRMDAEHAAKAHLLRPGRCARQAGGVLHAGKHPVQRRRQPAARVCNSTWMRAWSSTIPAPGESGDNPRSSA